MSTPYVLKGWKTREWQKALELASAVDGNDPEMHLIGGTYVEVGRNAQGPYVEVNSGDANGRDLRLRRVYMKPKPTRTSKRKANGKLRRTKAACSLRGRQTRLGNGSAASHLATHCPPLGVRKGNGASAKKDRRFVVEVLEDRRWRTYDSAAKGSSAADVRRRISNYKPDLQPHEIRVTPLGVRKGNDASPKVRVLSMKKKTRTIRGVGFNSYDVNLMVGNQFVTIEADAYRRPVLPESIRDGATREAILHAVQHYRSGR